MPQVSKKEAEEYLESVSKRKPQKKKSRFGGDNKVVLPGMPTAINANISEDNLQMYLLQLQIEDYTRRIREEDIGSANIPIEDRISSNQCRSPSPEAVYDCEGKRLNTRQYRARRKLEEKRGELIDSMLKLNPTYTPPTDYRLSSGRITDKVYIPQNDHPEINFVGLLIGPRGNTLKMLERETGARIIIRGQGSLKDGKAIGFSLPGEDEPLHAYITGCTEDQVKKAHRRISQIIREGVELPEAENDLRKTQLKELALLNGTLQDPGGIIALRQRNEANMIFTNTVKCSRCGGYGHLTSDCIVDLSTISALERNLGKVDTEYVALLNELGQPLPAHLQNAGIKQYSGPSSYNPYEQPLMLGGVPGVVPFAPMVAPHAPMVTPHAPMLPPNGPILAPAAPIPPPPPKNDDLDIPLPPS